MSVSLNFPYLTKREGSCSSKDVESVWGSRTSIFESLKLRSGSAGDDLQGRTMDGVDARGCNSFPSWSDLREKVNERRLVGTNSPNVTKLYLDIETCLRVCRWSGARRRVSQRGDHSSKMQKLIDAVRYSQDTPYVYDSYDLIKFKKQEILGLEPEVFELLW